MAHKLAHYVSWLMSGMYTPDVCERVLVRLIQGHSLDVADEGVYDYVVGGGWLPKPELGWDLDRWWQVVVRQRREKVKQQLVYDFGESCECCESAPGLDMHEVFEVRSDDTTWRQLFAFTVSNCSLVCPECHQSGAVYQDEFKEKIRARRQLVYST